MTKLPRQTQVIVVGGGFAGIATAWALSQNKLGPGVILEREATAGEHASGRNAGLARVVEPDAAMRTIALRSVARIRSLCESTEPLIRPTGSLTLGSRDQGSSLESTHEGLRQAAIMSELMSAADAQRRFPCLAGTSFDMALWCPADGVVNIHALLMAYLQHARAGGFELHTRCRVDALLLEGSRVSGVVVGETEIRADLVIDATGAWAGSLARKHFQPPLQPFRRHLFVSGPSASVDPNWPYVWLLHGEAYCRPEGAGWLLSPCDETPSPPGVPSTDPAAASLLAETLSRCAPGFTDLTLRRCWACLRTFAPDRRPVIGPDPCLRGFYHVSGLGGSGMTASAAVGELAADLVEGVCPDWLDPACVTPARFAENAE